MCSDDGPAPPKSCAWPSPACVRVRVRVVCVRVRVREAQRGAPVAEAIRRAAALRAREGSERGERVRRAREAPRTTARLPRARRACAPSVRAVAGAGGPTARALRRVLTSRSRSERRSS
eukprot:7330320-Prymnesium_polylepis.1